MQDRLGIHAIHPKRPQRHLLAEPGSRKTAQCPQLLCRIKRPSPERPDPTPAGKGGTPLSITEDTKAAKVGGDQPLSLESSV